MSVRNVPGRRIEMRRECRSGNRTSPCRALGHPVVLSGIAREQVVERRADKPDTQRHVALASDAALAQLLADWNKQPAILTPAIDNSGTFRTFDHDRG